MVLPHCPANLAEFKVPQKFHKSRPQVGLACLCVSERRLCIIVYVIIIIILLLFSHYKFIHCYDLQVSVYTVSNMAIQGNHVDSL